jgi:hypothetical protein
METLTLAPPLAGRVERPEPVGTLGVVEMMLKAPARLQEWMRDATRQPELMARFLAIALTGFTIFGVAQTLVLNASGDWPSWIPSARWTGRSAANLALAYDVGLVAAAGICLPSFYFFGLLAGLRITMLEVAVHSVKCLATTAVFLVGILPIYVAVALGMIVFDAAWESLQMTLAIGLALPFLAGLWGVWTLYEGFVALGGTLPEDRRWSRTRFLRRLTLAWSVCYSLVTPVMIASLWRHLSG